MHLLISLQNNETATNQPWRKWQHREIGMEGSDYRCTCHVWWCDVFNQPFGSPIIFVKGTVFLKLTLTNGQQRYADFMQLLAHRIGMYSDIHWKIGIDIQMTSRLIYKTTTGTFWKMRLLTSENGTERLTWIGVIISALTASKIWCNQAFWGNKNKWMNLVTVSKDSKMSIKASWPRPLTKNTTHLRIIIHILLINQQKVPTLWIGSTTDGTNFPHISTGQVPSIEITSIHQIVPLGDDVPQIERSTVRIREQPLHWA